MIRGIYTAAAGMTVKKTWLEIVSNNLANANTSGYKKDVMAFRNLIDAQNLFTEDPQAGAVESVITDFSQGVLRATGNPFDLAIEGKGFFVLDGATGARYSRDGHFQVNSEGILVGPAGLPVLGENGEITITENDFQVNRKGEIYSQGKLIDRLLIVDFPADSLRKAGNNLFEPAPGAPDPVAVESQVIQGHLEEANINIVEEMINLILLSRDFNESQKTIQTQDETLRRTVQDLGRV